jgi:hypothetical protein
MFHYVNLGESDLMRGLPENEVEFQNLSNYIALKVYIYFYFANFYILFFTLVVINFNVLLYVHSFACTGSVISI